MPWALKVCVALHVESVASLTLDLVYAGQLTLARVTEATKAKYSSSKNAHVIGTVDSSKSRDEVKNAEFIPERGALLLAWGPMQPPRSFVLNAGPA